MSPKQIANKADFEYMEALRKRDAANELEPVVYTSKYMLKPIDQTEESFTKN